MQNDAVEREEEDRAVGTVRWVIYWQYFMAGGNIFTMIAILLLCVLTQAVYNGGDWWLSVWLVECIIISYVDIFTEDTFGKDFLHF